MEPWTSAPCRVHALLLLLLLLQRPPGCSGTGDPSGTVSAAAAQDNPCGPRAPRQAPTPPAVPVTPIQGVPSCGFSKERDPTLRDPEAMARRWPWMVSVRANGIHICAGTLISYRWVLTVAHCLTESNVHYTVKMGSPWLDREANSTSEVSVLQVIVNSRFRAQRYWSWIGRANDIGLLELQQVSQYSKYVWPICLPGPDFTVKEQTVCTVTGWGLSKANGTWPQFRTIQEKEVTVLSTKDCDSFYHKFSRTPKLVRIINPQMLCAEDTSREEFCYEETGEPLVCLSGGAWYLLGMASWGAGCEKRQAPPIYMQVSSYHQWIWDTLNNLQPRGPPAPARALLLALVLPLGLLTAV